MSILFCSIRFSTMLILAHSRHLSRPAHRLTVTPRAISSFDLDDPEFRHPRVGVCRFCWRSFSNKLEFDAHLSIPCQRVSRGKEEKWRVLHDSFTPLCDPADTIIPVTQPAQQTGDGQNVVSLPDDSPMADAGGDTNGADEAGTPSTSVPSPVLPSDTGSFLPAPMNAGRIVSVDEHSRLQREHNALRERHQQLERVAQVLLAQRMMQQPNLSHSAATTNDNVVIPGPSSVRQTSNHPIRTKAPLDRDNLVQHMDSQSTNVDVQGFMNEMEDTFSQQSASGYNSASASSTASRSTIHRVPPSPPSQPAPLPGDKVENPPSHHTTTALAHRPPLPSIPDSGYGTEQRRGSLGELQQEALAKLITPPSSNEAAVAPGVTEATTTDDLGNIPPNSNSSTSTRNSNSGYDSELHWGATATPPLRRVQHKLSPHHSQNSDLFLADQEMADYSDQDYSLFYQDSSGRNLFNPNASPNGFDFEFPPSQTEQ